MSSELSETIPLREPRPPEELGGDIARTCIDLLDGRDRRFSKVLTDGSILQDVSIALTRYLEQLESTHPNEVIRAVSVTVNDYLKELGIGLMSCRVEPLNRDMDSMLLRDEWQYPTIGVIPETSELGSHPKIACFQVKNGGEELTAVTTDLCLRGYLPGENPLVQEITLQPVRQGTRILIPSKATIGVRVSLVDETRLNASGFSHNVFPITRDDLRIERNIHPGQVYFCRYLTREAVREALGL